MRQELLKTVGWAAFVGFGIALGLVLGSLGADVPADAGMLVFVGVVAAGFTLVGRLFKLLWEYRPNRPTPHPQSRQPARRPSDAAPRSRPPSEPGRRRPPPRQTPRRP